MSMAQHLLPLFSHCSLELIVIDGRGLLAGSGPSCSRSIDPDGLAATDPAGPLRLARRRVDHRQSTAIVDDHELRTGGVHRGELRMGKRNDSGFGTVDRCDHDAALLHRRS